MYNIYIYIHMYIGIGIYIYIYIYIYVYIHGPPGAEDPRPAVHAEVLAKRPKGICRTGYPQAVHAEVLAKNVEFANAKRRCGARLLR